jgi:hypothetical protein
MRGVAQPSSERSCRSSSPVTNALQERHPRPPGRALGRFRCAVLGLAVLQAACGDGLQKPALTEATSGFDPNKDAFSFENFAGYVSTAIFDAWSMRRMFGDNVCLQLKGGTCVLRPEAEAFADQVNAATSGGLCEGFAALPALSFTKKVQLEDIGIKTDAFLVDREQAQLIDREIAYWFGTQLLPAVKAGTKRVTGREAVEILGNAFKTNPKKSFRLGMVRMNAKGQAEGGHALMPYATKRVSDSKWQILVYDSNHPAKARAVDVDVNADSWKYLASINPSAPAGMYTGKGTKNRLYLIDNDLRVGQQPCPFCPGGAGGSQTILSFGAIMASVQTADGKQAGNTGDGLKDDEAGTSVTPVYGLPSGSALLEDQVPLAIDVSKDAKPTIKVTQAPQVYAAAFTQDSKSSKAGPASLQVLQGDGAFATVKLKDALNVDLTVKATGPGEVALDSKGNEPIKVTAGLVTTDGKSVTVGVVLDNPAGGQAVGLKLSKADGATTVELPKGGTATVTVAVATAEGKTSFTGTVDGASGDKVAIDVAAMKPGTAPPTGKDADGDGKPDDPKPMPSCANNPNCAKKGDNDIVPDAQDNCPNDDNPDQADLDKDGIGDVCDDDADGDGVPKSIDCNDFDATQTGPCTTSASPVCTKDADCAAPAGTCFAAKCEATGSCAIVPAPDGQACEDGNGCTVQDACKAGKCAAGSPKDCNDSNPCTAEACKDGSCATVPNELACNDGNACTIGDVCSGGACTPGKALTCSDGNPCTSDACDPQKGCAFAPTTDPCDDNNPCTAKDTCQDGVCKPLSKVPCDDGNPCTTEACDDKGSCAFTNNTLACNDGDVCTLGDACKEGACLAGVAAPCSDGNPCTEELCDSSKGCVVLPGAGTCSDANACTQDDTCQQGNCTGGKVIPCNDGNPCTLDGCDVATGCTFSKTTAACDDGNACTGADVCKDNSCTSGAAVVCGDGNPCTEDGCDAKTGCAFLANAAPCTDGNACTVGDACKGGVCLPGASTVCDDANPCTADSCDVVAGCKFAPKTQPCDDGSACTVGDVCQDGACTPGKPVVCNDGNGCTDDGCDAATGCTNAANTAPCTDGNACSVGDACKGGVCLPGASTVCDDANPCTADSCDAVAGCKFAPKAQPCDDGSACTVGDVCQGGACAPGKPLVCNDGNGCTDDSCDATTGCTSAANTAPCNDGNTCSVDDTCKDGACQPGTATVCDDGNPCTTDSCDAKAGCKATANALPCTDGSVCTVGDACKDGACGAGKSVNCNDGNACTQDECDAQEGCLSKEFSAPCSDGNNCTLDDACQKGACLPGAAKVCDDANPCTTDHCDAKAGCKFAVNSLPCDDGSVCTVGDVCDAGACKSGKPVNCNDGNVCTDDACDQKAGCTQQANGAACNDNNVCTAGETCKGGACAVGMAVACTDDGNTCTDAVCDPAAGCKNVNNALTCDDGKACTVGDTCIGGKCTAQPKDCGDGQPCTTDSCGEPVGCANVAVADFTTEAQWAGVNIADFAGVEVDATGNTYFASGQNATSNIRVRKYDKNGVQVATFATAAVPAGMERVGSKIFTTLQGGALAELNTSSLALTTVIGGVGGPDPTDLTQDATGNWWVAFASGKACQVSAVGKVVTCPTLCTGAARGIDYGNGRIYITCPEEKAVKAFNADSKLVAQATKLACTSAAGGYALADVEVAPDGSVLATCGDTVQRFDKDCKPISKIDLPAALFVAAPKEGKVVVASGLQTFVRYAQTACDDGKPCTAQDGCAGGACAGIANDCNDSNICTDDACDAKSGDCTHSPNTATCEDGLPCTTDLCSGGSCVAGPNCSPDATCGGTTCTCNAGYKGDGFTCGDVDECLTNNGGCSANATCTNKPGSNTCTCKSGYTGDGITCKLPTVAFGFTGGVQTYQVPAGVTKLAITIVGGGGGGGGNDGLAGATGGTGGKVVLPAVAVTPGATLQVVVGGGGKAGVGCNTASGGGGATFMGGGSGGNAGSFGCSGGGGGGGGLSGIFNGNPSQGTAIAVAGGGGGGGGAANSPTSAFNGGAGGSAAPGAFAAGGNGLNYNGGCQDGGGGGGGGGGFESGAPGSLNQSVCDANGFGGGGGSSFIAGGLSGQNMPGLGSQGGGPQQDGAPGSVVIVPQ